MAEKQRYDQIDFLKCMAIIMIICIHTVSSYPQKNHLYESFHINQAVAIFMILMGLNMALSFKKFDSPRLRDLYNKDYFVRRASRVLVPFFVVLLCGLALVYATPSSFHDYIPFYSTWNFAGILPIYGPGSYFVTLIFEFTLVFPLIYWFYRKNPLATLVGCFAIDIGFQLAVPQFSIFNKESLLYETSILRFFSAIALGVWISDDFSLKSKRNWFIWIGFIVSLVYLIADASTGYLFPYFSPMLRTQNVISYFYTLVIVMVGLWALPSSSNRLGSRLLKKIGVASYHIFLVQIVYFEFMWDSPIKADNYPMDIILHILVNLAICATIGVLFMEAENYGRRKMAAWRKGSVRQGTANNK